ncbi:leucine-rich repeat-containing protein 71 isoform X1 [Nothobranchius furzeri]|uniref:leucine-rich repeat-containing protein 71 isoform X1 n=1 Tax=Nothobranchius furzeri TaxID=105023 RepID=UPI002403EE70|nr:leucine-rich repeat-containing protein 71 isoform X1 [Nothobranchius furzeri]
MFKGAASTDSALTFDEYQCTGNVETDFPELCALLGVKNIPEVCTKSSTITRSEGVDAEDKQDSPHWSVAQINVELENKNPLSAKKITISGWKVNERIFRVLQKMLPSLSQIASLQLWHAGLTDQMVASLANTLPLCSSLRVVSLEGNVLQDQSFHLLFTESCVLTQLHLRCNRIGDEGARLIGSALSTPTSANKNLVYLNLAFNWIGDAGAAHIAQGLRLNRTLLLLSLANNMIGDLGAAHLAAILVDFPLTHEEIVERRKLTLQRIRARPQSDSVQSPVKVVSEMDHKDTSRKQKQKESSRKNEKTTGKKETANTKIADIEAEVGNPGKQLAKEDPSRSLNEAESEETEHLLLDKSVYSKDGQLFLPGHKLLTSLNLSGNRITEKSLPLFLNMLEMQEEKGRSLLRLRLQRNLFPEEHPTYLKIEEILALRSPQI